MRTLFFCVLPGIAVGLTVGCETYIAPVEEEPYVFHASFDFGVSHEQTGCDACHVLAADVMLKQTPDTPGSGWVTFLELDPLSSCVSCHPFVRNNNNPEHPEVTVDCRTLVEGDPLLETERCRYELSTFHSSWVDDSPFNGAHDGCAGSGCHTLQSANWGTGGGGPGDPPGGGPHDTPPLRDIFPLVTPHAGLECGDCHAGATSAEVGKQCLDCHGRTSPPPLGPSAGANHYPPARPGAPDEERLCWSCHQDYSLGGTPSMPVDWGNRAPGKPSVNHTFLVAHNSTDTFRDGAAAANPNPPTSFVEACWTCHNQYPNDATPPTTIYMDFATPVGRAGCTNACHATVLEADVGNHFSGTSCTESLCHATAGPGDDVWD